MKRKIAIVGGGMAGLAAAFDLARTQDLRDRYDVTVYQMGWRLGGKAASSRYADGRVVEHGLHVWFGGYQNAFQLLQAAYLSWRPHRNQAIKQWKDAFEAHRFTVITGSGDQSKISGILWPPADGFPGDGGPLLTLWPCVTQLLGVIETQYKCRPHDFDPGSLNIPERIVALLAEASVKVDGVAPHMPENVFGLLVPFDHSVEATTNWARALEQTPDLRTEAQLRGFVEYLRLVSGHLWGAENSRDQGGHQFLCELIDVGTALVKGVILDVALGGACVADLDAWDFREWLCGFGAHRDAVYGSSIVQSLYDATFQYEGGDKRRPSFGAGSAAQVSLRLFGGYRDAFAYETKAGLGEVAIVPIYRALRRWGVKFEFFHKLTRVELSEDGRAVARLRFDRQVELQFKYYCPTIRPMPEFGNLEHWPNEPRWRQIKHSCKITGIDLESSWSRHRGCEVTLAQGEAFDDVVLAIPVGAIRPREGDAGPCAELIAASRRFRQMAMTASLTPTVSFQAWCTKTLEEMGWPPAMPCAIKGQSDCPTCSGPSPLNIWSDRTLVMAYENWPSGRSRAQVIAISLRRHGDVVVSRAARLRSGARDGEVRSAQARGGVA